MRWRVLISPGGIISHWERCHNKWSEITYFLSKYKWISKKPRFWVGLLLVSEDEFKQSVDPSTTEYCTTIYVTTPLGNNEALTGPAKLVAPLESMLANFTLVPEDGVTVQRKELWFTEEPKLHRSCTIKRIEWRQMSAERTCSCGFDPLWLHRTAERQKARRERQRRTVGCLASHVTDCQPGQNERQIAGPTWKKQPKGAKGWTWRTIVESGWLRGSKDRRH